MYACEAQDVTTSGFHRVSRRRATVDNTIERANTDRAAGNW